MTTAGVLLLLLLLLYVAPPASRNIRKISGTWRRRVHCLTNFLPDMNSNAACKNRNITVAKPVGQASAERNDHAGAVVNSPLHAFGFPFPTNPNSASSPFKGSAGENVLLVVFHAPW